MSNLMDKRMEAVLGFPTPVRGTGASVQKGAKFAPLPPMDLSSIDRSSAEVGREREWVVLKNCRPGVASSRSGLLLGIALLLFFCWQGGSLSAQDAVPRLTFVELFHIDAEDAIQFLRDTPSLEKFVNDQVVRPLANKPRSLLITADEAKTQQLIKIIRDFEALEVRGRVRQEMLHVRYASIQLVLETLAASQVCQVWHRTEEVKNDVTKQGNKTITHTYKKGVYSRYDAAKGEVLPSFDLPEIPYVMEIPQVEPIALPPVNMGQVTNEEQVSLTFTESPSTEVRNRIMIVGTDEDLAKIKKFIDQVDVPARQIMIEVQIIELEASSLTDLGIDVLAFEKRHDVVNFASPLPGEAIQDVSENFQPIDQSGLSFLFDDTTERLSGQFLAKVHALVRNGDAVIKARPKLYTLDDRQSQLHLGSEIPTFISTDVVAGIAGGNFVENINKVGTRHIGTTLVVKPRVSGPEANEVSMLVDIQVNNLQGRSRVFEQDLLGIPEVAVRNFRGQARVRNHRPLILGGLIKESEFQSKNKIPILGDIPIIGDLLGRTNKQEERSEIIIVLTPHILSEQGVDPISTPKESRHFDTYNSVLFNDRYILKGRDLVGLDPISRSPVEGWSVDEVLDLTLLNIVKKRELVSKLQIFEDYLPESADSLSTFKRKFPEKSLRSWTQKEQRLYFQAAAILVENIKSLNPDLDYDDIVEPRREIVVPTSPYHVSLSFDKMKNFYEKGHVVLARGETNLSSETLEVLRTLSGRSMREFSSFLTTIGRAENEHGQFREELTRYLESLYPEAASMSGMIYVDFVRELDEFGVDFVGISTYLGARLETQFRDQQMSLGVLEDDLRAFENRTITLDELGERLQTLDERWNDLNTSVSRPVRGL